MAKTPSEKSRDTEARKKARGLHEYRVWAPKTDEAANALRKLAERLTRAYERAVKAQKP